MREVPLYQVVALHKTVRETLVYLTHLDHQQTEEVMIEKLGLQVTDQKPRERESERERPPAAAAGDTGVPRSYETPPS